MWIWPEGEAHIANYSWMEKSDVVSGFSPHYLWLGRLQLYKSQMSQWKWCNLTFLDTKQANTNYILPLWNSVLFPAQNARRWKKYIMVVEGCSYCSLTIKSIFCWAKPKMPKLQLTWRAFGPDPILSPTISVSVMWQHQRWTRNTWTLRQRRQLRFISHAAKENLRLCLGSTLLIFGEDL